jgi:hypothetical protein
VSRRAVLAAVALALAAPLAAAGHEPMFWYNFWWQEGPYPNSPQVAIHWADRDFENGGVAGAAARDAVLRGFGVWNNAGSRLKFFNAGFNYSIAYNSCNDYDQNGVFWAPVAGRDAVADVQACVFAENQTQYWSWNMRFSSSVKWNRDASRGPTLLETDLVSFAAHEAGHAAGHWIHWNQGGAPGLCPVNDTLHTMCSATPSNKAWWRSLEKHDVHTFRLTYP